MSTSSNKSAKNGENGMGKAGKRKEMVEDRCAQGMHVEVRCAKRSVCKGVACKSCVCLRV